MFEQLRIPSGCRKYEARLEDYIHGASDSELDEHLRQCAKCSTALENSRLAGNLIRQVCEPAEAASPAFLAGVRAKIRAEQLRVASPAAFWNPLEFLASRLSMTAAVVLLAMSAYLVGFAPGREPVMPLPNRTELSASDFPQPPGDPDSNEEVLQSLSERRYGR